MRRAIGAGPHKHPTRPRQPIGFETWEVGGLRERGGRAGAQDRRLAHASSPGFLKAGVWEAGHPGPSAVRSLAARPGLEQEVRRSRALSEPAGCDIPVSQDIFRGLRREFEF